MTFGPFRLAARGVPRPAAPPTPASMGSPNIDESQRPNRRVLRYYANVTGGGWKQLVAMGGPIRFKCSVLWVLSASSALAFEPEDWLRVSWTHLEAMETTTTSHTIHPSPSVSARIWTEYQVSADDGPEIEFSRRFKSWLGFSVGARYFSVDFVRRERHKLVDRNTNTSYVVWYSHSERTRIAQVSSDLSFHLLRRSRADLWIGPVLGFSWYDDLYGRRVDDHFYYGLAGALGIPVRSRWRVFLGVEFLFAGAEPLGRAEIDYDPRMIQIGFAWRLDRP